MKRVISLAIGTVVGAAVLASTAQAYDGDWKRGRVYFRAVCTECHTAKAGGGEAIPPNGRTVAEWTAYLKADKHAKGKDTVSQYTGKDYRTSIKATNKAAEKFLPVADQDLFEDVKIFLLKGAKDGDSPASCS
ncbi:MAG: hypothetical protein HY985_03855 [Magnetospirillum sp.]|nr:hypothetical protein [Magnetospirillum sp.]